MEAKTGYRPANEIQFESFESENCGDCVLADVDAAGWSCRIMEQFYTRPNGIADEFPPQWHWRPDGGGTCADRKARPVEASA